MDRISNAILEKINGLTGTGRYVIISEDEFFECFPENEEPCEAELKKALRSLIADGYIDLKYSSGSMFCVTTLKAYKPEETTETEPEPQPPREQRIGLKLFLSAFAGGLAGSLTVSLIFALI